MYAKPSTWGLLAFAGAAALPAASPAFIVAKVLLEITGAGFILYCLGALIVCAAGYRLRRRDRAQEQRATAGVR
jgi:hypothetical protein